MHNMNNCIRHDLEDRTVRKVRGQRKNDIAGKTAHRKNSDW